MRYFLASWLVGLAALAVAGAVLLSPRSLAHSRSPAVPTLDHIVVAILENHSFPQIMDDGSAPFIRELAGRGALFTRSFALLHPSQPNYFALFSGSTHNVSDDGDHTLNGPTLADLLRQRGKAFIGYIEDGSPRKHNPWESFPDGRSMERRLSDFPADFERLPAVSFVIPNQQHDMHDGSVERGDRWLREHLGAYADWCRDHNSLLVVTFDEDDDGARNRIPTIFVGSGIVPGRYDRRIDHYSVLRTILAVYDLPPLAQTAFASPITDIWHRK
ncbi:alkaline phosphatase family protein [Enhydrobacter sp.]|jgi:acid phosphatase|uniref:alkaline phosphatase family protein n=1 Tax=Enhydrobacter sp. TaxID=1894999 RepID=UPI002629375C|nr:alkaline phosphatase family protein [Enhydrobacter sp.]WIM10868.1 MAG: Acid phosphatase [Enhydrobacter sp.]